MTRIFKLAVLVAPAFALVACTDMYGAPNRPANGAIIGGLTGVALGNAIGGSQDARLIGGVLGAVVGSSIGAQLQAQEDELNRSMAGSGAQIVNTGKAIQVTLPENVTFAFGSSQVNPGFMSPLSALAQNLSRYPNSVVRVVGHTDNVGSAAYNDTLSTERALAVSRILIANGLPSGRLTYSGQGFNQPIASNSTSAGRAMNRRVEILITPTQ